MSALRVPHPQPRGPFSLAEFSDLSGNRHQGTCAHFLPGAHTSVSVQTRMMCSHLCVRQWDIPAAAGGAGAFVLRFRAKETSLPWRSSPEGLVLSLQLLRGPFLHPSIRDAQAGLCPFPCLSAHPAEATARAHTHAPRLWPPMSFVSGIKKAAMAV